MLFEIFMGAALAAGAAPPVAGPPPVAPQQVVATPWAENLTVARERAKSGTRPLLVNFHTQWCGWCKRMERETFRDARVLAKSREEFVFVSLDADDGADGSRLAREHRVSSYPTQLLLDETGREIGRFKGFRAADGFLAELERVGSERKKLTELLAKEERSPRDPQILFDLASTLARGQRREEAAKRFDLLLELDDEPARRFRDVALWSSATLEIELGKNDGALRRYQAYVTEFPTGPKAELGLYQIARIHQTEKRKEQALLSYGKLLEQFPAGRYATAARLQLQLLEAQR